MAPDDIDDQLRQAILTLVEQRGADRTVCPSEAARAVAGDDFAPLMARTRAVAAQLRGEGRIDVTQRGRPVNPDDARGPIRLRLRRAET